MLELANTHTCTLETPHAALCDMWPGMRYIIYRDVRCVRGARVVCGLRSMFGRAHAHVQKCVRRRLTWAAWCFWENERMVWGLNGRTASVDIGSNRSASQMLACGQGINRNQRQSVGRSDDQRRHTKSICVERRRRTRIESNESTFRDSAFTAVTFETI